jgi:hypothetical protein
VNTNKPSDSLKFWNILEWRGNYWFLKETLFNGVGWLFGCLKQNMGVAFRTIKINNRQERNAEDVILITADNLPLF